MKDPWDPEIRYKILRDADFYALEYARILTQINDLVRPVCTRFAYKNHYRAVATYEVRALPSELKGWVYDYVSLADEHISHHFCDFTIRDKGLDLLPDIFSTYNHAVVTETVRDFFITEDPEGCQFFPIRIVATKTDRERDEPRFAVMPRRFFQYEGDAYDGLEPQNAGVDFAAKRTRVAFEKMKAAQLFAAQFPIFSARLGLKTSVFNRATFRKMKERGFTGLVECETETYLGKKDDWECVGHVNFRTQDDLNPDQKGNPVTSFLKRFKR